MTARGAAPPVVEEGTEPNPPPAWRPGDPASAPPPAPPPPPPVAEPTPSPSAPSAPAAERPARERLAAPPASGGEPGSESMRAFMDRLVRGNRRSGRGAPPAAASDADAGGGDEAPAAPAPGDRPDDPSRTRADAAAPAGPWAPPASKEEEERRIQAEVDRRAFKAQRQAAEQGRRTRAQQLEGLEAEEQQLRRTDVYAAAQRRDEIDAMRAQDQFLSTMVQAYDRVSLDPLMLALPEAERAPILEAMPPGMDGRKYVTETALARIKALAAADAERKLRRSPVFRKQVLAELRGDAPEDDDEPELGGDRRPAPVRPNRGRSPMDALIRRGFGQAV